MMEGEAEEPVIVKNRLGPELSDGLKGAYTGV